MNRQFSDDCLANQWLVLRVRLLSELLSSGLISELNEHGAILDND